jgi:glycosyltransferase involved in cell wall biosynthesis
MATGPGGEIKSTSPADAAAPDVVVLTPVYDDWESFFLFLPHLDRALSTNNLSAEVLVVDDASHQRLEDYWDGRAKFEAVRRIRILELIRNCGHQRAIALGLAYLEAESKATPHAVVVMDADGEDDPEDVPRLIQAMKDDRHIVFAFRERRSEGPVFSFFYFLYRKMFRALVGKDVQFGNFSLIPGALLRRVVSLSEIWNHYAIGILKARIPFTAIPTRRANRLAGRTHMNRVALILHGLSAIAIYGDVLGVRAAIATSLMVVPIVLAALTAVAIRLFTSLAIPGWATYVVALALIAGLQFATLAAVFVFLILHSRSSASFLPRRDYEYFISGIREIY